MGSLRSSVRDDDWAVLEEYGTSNTITKKYLQGYHGLVKTLQDNIYYYQDELGSTSHIASLTGALLEYYKYDLYGKPQVYNSGGVFQPGAIPMAKDLFTGQRWVNEISLYDDRNRFMSPELGRFIQPDPIGFKGDGSNLYRYCGNDWANRTDPDGTYALVDDAILFGGGALVGLGAQGLSDLLTWHNSGWEAYLGAGLGGGIGGVAVEYTGPAAPFVGSAAANFITQEARISTGKQAGFNGRELVGQTAVGGIVGSLPIRGIPMGRVNRGSNSYSAIAGQVHTKFENNTIKGVTTNTAAKAVVGRAANDSGKGAAEGAVKAAERAGESNSTPSSSSSQQVQGHMEFSLGRNPSTGRINTPLLMNGRAQPVPTPPPTPTTSGSREQSP